jgi:PPOX class probable F420-dependent enzyme
MEEATNHFAPLAGAEFIVLTTYKRAGDAMPTTVWFVEQGGKLYVTTQSEAGKAKRIRATPAVTVAPSDRVGTVSGPAVPAQARILGPDEAVDAEAALRAKYGEQYDIVTARTPTNGVRVFIEVSPPA